VTRSVLPSPATKRKMPSWERKTRAQLGNDRVEGVLEHQGNAMRQLTFDHIIGNDNQSAKAAKWQQTRTMKIVKNLCVRHACRYRRRRRRIKECVCAQRSKTDPGETVL